MSGRTYPPVDHLLRHLRMSFELRSADELVGSMPVSDDLRDPGGSPRMGAIAAFVDVAAGAFAHEQVRPDWLATTDMRVMLRRSSDADSVDVRTVAVRTGRRSVMTETQVSDGRGEFARGWVTYTRLPRRDDSPTLAGGSGVGRTFRYIEPDEAKRTRPSFDDYLGLELAPPESADVITMTAEHRPQIHNSFGSLQGGAGAAFVERAAVVAGERAWGCPTRVTDLQTYYLGQTREGPFRVDGEVLGSDDASISVEARVLDAGNDDKLLDLGTAVARPLRDA